MIRSLKIYQRLLLTFGVLFALLVFANSYPIIQSRAARDTQITLNQHNRDINTLEILQAEFLQARLDEVNFINQWQALGYDLADSRYLLPHQAHLDTLLALLQTLSLDDDDLSTLNQHLASYQDAFTLVAASAEQDIPINEADGTAYQLAAHNILEESERLIAETSLDRDRTAKRLDNLYTDTERVETIILGVAFVGGGIWALVMSISIVVPLRRLERAAALFRQGNFNHRIDDQSQDEIGTLAQSLNQVGDSVEALVVGLEERVAASTRDLQTVIDINTQIVTILDVQRLLQAVVSLTKDRFDLYHAHVYRVDEGHLALTAGAGAVGRLLVEQGHVITLDHPKSIVAQAARERSAILVNDTAASSSFLPNRLLPDTRSELAVPLISRGQILGVLDVQSETVNFFDDRIMKIMNVLATQIANALLNVQLYEEAARISRHERALGQLTQAIQEANSVDDVLQAAVRELGKALRVPHTAIELQLRSES